MKLQALGSWTALLTTLTLSFGTCHAVDLVDLAKAPGWYGTEVVETDDKGQPVKRVVFSAQPVAMSMVDLNQVLTAYGLSVVDGRRAPEGHMQESLSSDRGERVVVFDGQPKGLAPVAIDGILAAYGVRVVDAAKLPTSYGTAVTTRNAQGAEVQEIQFSGTAYAISPAEWHRILSAYGK